MYVCIQTPCCTTTTHRFCPLLGEGDAKVSEEPWDPVFGFPVLSHGCTWLFCVSCSRVASLPWRTILYCLRENIEWNLKCIMADLPFQYSLYYLCVGGVAFQGPFVYGTEKTTLWNWFSFSSLVCIVGFNFKCPGFHDKSQYSLSHLSGSQLAFFLKNKLLLCCPV